MKFEKVPVKLKGLILIYSDGGTPSMRQFKSRQDLELWVGRWYLTVGMSDCHWIDGIVEGEIEVLDESVRLYDEDAGAGAEPEDQGEREEPSEGDQELDGVPVVDLTGEPSPGGSGVPEYVPQDGTPPPDQL